MSTTPMKNEPNLPKPGKGQFKCFHCRKIFPMKDGDWYSWKSMEVHLCKACEAATRSKTERGSSK